VAYSFWISGKTTEALTLLQQTSLPNGWVEDFNNNWWYLEDDPFFKNLRDMDKFKQLIEQHHTTISQLFEPGNT
jgi:hypothetical protein